MSNGPEITGGATQVRQQQDFLRELWTHRQRVKPMGKFELLSYFVRRGLETLLNLPMSTLLTTITIAAVLFMLSGMMLFFKNVDSLIANVGGGRQFTVYLKDDATPQQVLNLETLILRSPQVDSALHVTKQEALEIFGDHLGPHADLLKGLEKDNPLPASLDVYLRTEGPVIGDARIAHLMSRLKSNEAVEDVAHTSQWTTKVQSILQVTRVFSGVSLAIALAIAVFIISTTIQLVIFTWRDEIAIMRLIGAADVFVRVPFLLGGFAQGLVGSVLGLVLLKIAFVAVAVEIASVEFFGLVVPEPSFLSLSSSGFVLLIGSCTGLLGSALALRRFMHV
jgi:cell division transport system permease protein